MSETARDYITLRATGRDVEDYALVREIRASIGEMLGEVLGFQVMRMERAEHIEEELRDSAFFLEASGGRLPFMLVNVTFVTERVDPSAIRAFEERFALQLVAEQICDGP